MTIRVLIVDDHDMFAESIARALRDEDDIEVVAIAGSAADAIAAAAASSPDVALVDYRLPDANGAKAAGSILAVSPSTKALMLTAMSDQRTIAEAIAAGCIGFLTKDKGVRELVAAVRLAAEGQAHLSPADVRRLVPTAPASARLVGWDLTLREREILELVAAGLSNKDIAARLYLSVHTVRNQVQRILDKLGAHSKLEAAAIAVRERLVSGQGQ